MIKRLGTYTTGIRVHLTGNQTIPENGTQTRLNFQGIAWSYGGFTTNLISNEVIVPRTGPYLWVCKAYFYSAKAGPRRMILRQNYGNVDEIGGVALAGSEQFYTGVLPVQFNAGDTVTADAYVGGNTGDTSNATVYGAQPGFTFMSLVYLGGS